MDQQIFERTCIQKVLSGASRCIQLYVFCHVTSCNRLVKMYENASYVFIDLRRIEVPAVVIQVAASISSRAILTSWPLKNRSRKKIFAVMKFQLLQGKNPLEMNRELQQVFNESAPSDRTVRRWFDPFKDGRVNVEDDPRCSRPSTTTLEDVVKKVEENSSWEIDAKHVMSLLVMLACLLAMCAPYWLSIWIFKRNFRNVYHIFRMMMKSTSSSLCFSLEPTSQRRWQFFWDG